MVDLPRSVRSVDASFLSSSTEETAFPSKVVGADTSIFCLSSHPHAYLWPQTYNKHIQPDASCPCARAR